MKKEIEELLNSNITAYTIAKSLNLNPTTIQRYKNGINKIDNMTLATAEKLYNYYKQTKKGSK
ncbi:XRE family transcriptional regulator [Gemella sp. zg-1178]|uniref:XRE family transcriptional regulator n=1 Tax=Gemella sp. zg-1178 TaxID=2840372 RepID=UPI001C05DC6F|nr:XRE family transcriptional regulator [Gemella sp. zg-1178]MBU0279403.1 XRE family transcriptional regulator [Gemella sp. zg-1178]